MSGHIFYAAALLAVLTLGLEAQRPAEADVGGDINNDALAAALSSALPASPQYFRHPAKQPSPTQPTTMPRKSQANTPALETPPIAPEPEALKKIPMLSLNSPKVSRHPAPGHAVAKVLSAPASATKAPVQEAMTQRHSEQPATAFFAAPPQHPVLTPKNVPEAPLRQNLVAGNPAPMTIPAPRSSLYDLLQTAIAHNANIRLAAQGLRSADAGSLQAFGAFLPHLSFQAQSQMYVNTSGIPTASLVGSNIVVTQGSIYSNYMSIMASLNLFEGGSGVENLSAAHQGVVAAHDQILRQRNRAVLDLLVNFQQIQSLLQQQRILRKAITLAKEDLSLNEQKYRQGNESILELDKAREILLQYQSQQDDLQRQLLKSQTGLAELLGKQGSFALVSGAGQDRIPSPPDLAQNADETSEDSEIVNQLPSVEAELAKMREARHQVASVRGTFLPNVSLQAGYNWLGTSSHGFGPALNNVNRNNYTVGLNITQTLAPFTGHLAKLQDAEAKLESARIQYQQAILVGHQQLRVDREEIQEGARRVQTLHEEYLSARKNQQLTTALYEHGRVSKMELHMAILRALNTRSAWQQAQGEWLVARWMFYAMLRPQELVPTILHKTMDTLPDPQGSSGGHV
ncbi:TolC family protein [Acidithiobacillus sp. M4-SHS-6]|uniref:TolC family protein n=1 Tax=Acidithiobacillus sp. M4-SHS-6 TaxID=3383024 RepID=UPI0039BE3B0F